MGTPAPDGAIVTYVGTWPPGNAFGFSDYTGKVISDLTANGLLVKSFSSNAQTATLLGTNIQINLQLQVNTGVGGFGDINDLISVIQHYVIQETGSNTISDSVPMVQGVTGATAVTGQPGNPGGTGPASHQCGDPSWGFTDDPAQWFTCLSQKGLSTLGLVFIGLALGIVLLVTAQTKKTVGV